MKYTIQKADLWGNDKDGYEVNDWYPKHTLELDIDVGDCSNADIELIKSLVSADYFNDFVLLPQYSYQCDYESYADSGIVYITLRKNEENHEELYKLEQTELAELLQKQYEPTDRMALIGADIRPGESGYDYLINQPDEPQRHEE